MNEITKATLKNLCIDITTLNLKITKGLISINQYEDIVDIYIDNTINELEILRVTPRIIYKDNFFERYN